MNLREQIEKDITDKVITKLASEKVELAIIDDLKKHESAIKKIVQNSENQEEKLDKILNEVKSKNSQLIKDALSELDKAYNEFKKVSKMAKDLGIPVPSEYQTIITKMEKQVNNDIRIPSISSIPYK